MRVSVLIIGSLLWDSKPKRESWRQSRLVTSEAVHVEVPIRYGRQSQLRGNTYTMTFDKDGPLGQGVLVPCKADVCDTTGLVGEAEELWTAEHLDAEPASIGASWGCVGVLLREQALRGGPVWCWMKHFHNKAVPVPPVDRDGLLGIRWPNCPSVGPADADIILATATMPQTEQPTPEQVAKAWIGQEKGYEAYFFKNISSGIRTFQDRLIWAKMKEAKPKWLTGSAYSEAVAILAAEAQC